MADTLPLAAKPLAAPAPTPRGGDVPDGAPMAPAPTTDAPEDSSAKPGPPLLNGNRLSSGLHADPGKQALRLVLGTLPASLARVERDAYEYRRTLEQAVLEAHGEITLTMAHAIDTAARWFRHGQAALAWLVDHEPDMDHAQRLAYSTAVAKAATERDRAVDRLVLDRDQTQDLIARMYGPLPISQHQG